MLTVYGRATSSNVQAVMWGIAELGLECDRLDYGHIYGGLDTAEFRAMNPHGLIPVLRDGDLVVWESAAILRYLAAQYGVGGAFWPADPVQRATVDKWAEWGKTSFCGLFTVPIFWARVRTAASQRDEAALKHALAEFDRAVAALEQQLETGPYICGPKFTLADIIIGHVLYRYFDIDIPRGDHLLVRAYYNLLTQRPAFRDHVMISYASLAHPDAG